MNISERNATNAGPDYAALVYSYIPPSFLGYTEWSNAFPIHFRTKNDAGNENESKYDCRYGDYRRKYLSKRQYLKNLCESTFRFQLIPTEFEIQIWSEFCYNSGNNCSIIQKRIGNRRQYILHLALKVKVNNSQELIRFATPGFCYFIDQLHVKQKLR